MIKPEITPEIKIGRYSISQIIVRTGLNTPYKSENQILVQQHESGEGMTVPLEIFEEFFDKLWKNF